MVTLFVGINARYPIYIRTLGLTLRSIATNPVCSTSHLLFHKVTYVTSRAFILFIFIRYFNITFNTSKSVNSLTRSCSLYHNSGCRSIPNRNPHTKLLIKDFQAFVLPFPVSWNKALRYLPCR